MIHQRTEDGQATCAICIKLFQLKCFLIFMKHFLPFKAWNVTQVASNFLICQTELFQNSFLPFTIIEWNKLVPDVRNVETYSLFRNNLLAFIWPIKNFINSIYDPLGIKLLHKLRQGFSHL